MTTQNRNYGVGARTGSYGGGYGGSYGNYGGYGYGSMGMGMGMGMPYGMYGRGTVGLGGGMLGVMERMQMASWSIGMLGQGVQMFGMNATLIQNSITGLIQLLAQSTHSFNDLVGCKSDQTTAPLAQYKLAPPTTQLDPMTGQLIQHHSGELVPKSDEELEEENKRASRRRRMRRWAG